MTDLDKVAFSNLTNTYQNYRTISSSIVISGSIAAGGNSGNNFAPAFSYDRSATRADPYYQRPDTMLTTPANAGTRIATYLPTYAVYQFSGAEICYVYLDYLANNRIRFGVYIQNNTGSPITLVTQTINLILVLYDAPFA